ncbi:MAG: hypothetical protein LKF34_05635 [Acidaminococcaceae bacterium]|jgi:hypothetical protein|nr:hypothetical protein [Acidaminococcaceae bacterium]
MIKAINNKMQGNWRRTCAVQGLAGLALVAVLLGTCPVVSQAAPSAATVSTRPAVTQQVNEELGANWTSDARQTLNDFLRLYGKGSQAYQQNNKPYAVFDFDNTTSILDVEEQLEIWQLEHLAFAIKPEQMEQVLLTGIPADKLNLTYGAADGDGRPVQIRAAIKDAVRDYAALYKKGYVSTSGKVLSAAVQKEADYQDFVAKMRWLYDAIGETMDASVSYPWVTYWFTGMKPQEVYKLACTCDKYYGDKGQGQTWNKRKFTSPDQGAAGSVTVSFKQGITVTSDVKDLYRALDKHGVDTWIDSASPLDVVRAAVTTFKIPGVDGIVGMTNKLDKNGRYVNAYDYDLHAQTQGVGKSETLVKVVLPKYRGQGPSFCAMDSQGDFNFCTEFKDTKAVLIMNRTRKDDAALCAGIAAYQQEKNISLAQANLAGDTRFILQGRNENTGKLWPKTETWQVGKKAAANLSPKALKAKTELENGKSIAQVLQADTKLKDYQGYKTR